MFTSKTNILTNVNASATRHDGDTPFIQPKLKIGTPGDKYEVEADRAADSILAKSRDNSTSFFPASPSIQQQTAEETELQQKPVVDPITPGVQLKSSIQKAEEEELQQSVEEEVQQKSDTDIQTKGELFESESNGQVLQQQVEDEDLQKKEEEELQETEEEEVQTLQMSGGNDGSSLESNLNSSKTGGSALPAPTQSEMESGFGADFSNVRVHNDSNAVQMNQQLGSQAFTHGNHIYFNEGKYNPESDSGKHLLAHELTHTVQQGAASSVQNKLIQRSTGNTSTGSTMTIDTFQLPVVKQRHLAKYSSWTPKTRAKGYPFRRGKPKQIKVWENYFLQNMSLPQSMAFLRNEQTSGIIEVTAPVIPNKTIRGRKNTVIKKLSIPRWDRNNNVLDQSLEVDHIVELQIGNYRSKQDPANQIDNMELLDKSSNASAGSKTKNNIFNLVKENLTPENGATEVTDDQVKEALRTKDVTFTNVAVGQGDYAGNAVQSSYWSKDEIQRGDHLSNVVLNQLGEPGSETEFALMTPDDGFLLSLYPHAADEWQIPVGVNTPKGKAVKGLKISNISLSPNFQNKNVDENIGSLSYEWNVDSKLNPPAGVHQLTLKKSQSQYAGKLTLPQLNGFDFSHLSPVNISADYGINDDGLYAEATLIPSVSFLQNVEISVGINGTEAYFEAIYSPGNLNIPIPNLTLSNTDLWMRYGTSSGFAVGGGVSFDFANVATGRIEGSFRRRNGLKIEGQMNFDENLFGGSRASARVVYENNLWSIGGTLVIPENKVRGVKQATINVNYSETDGFRASGEAELDIPGIQRGNMQVNYGDQGFSIAGDFDLSPDIPGINSGRVSARVARQNGAENYDIMVSGTAQPAIPGINSELSVTYENGALTIEGSAAYSRGMLSGNVRIGATNRAIGDDGQPSGEPDGTMRVYGGGSLTLRLTPWLEATAGVNFLPNGEMEITGRIGLPDAVDLFDRKSIDRNLFNMPALEIPIFAIPLGPRSIGIVARITGGLDFSAGFGPGQLRNLSAEVTYNPDREDETTISGHGQFVIPADAGLKLRGDLGLGVSVGIASLTGGIEVTGELGLQGEALAQVDVNWSPQTGLAIDALGRVTVNPKFTFDLNAFARASLDLWLTSISKTWRYNLASFSWGPDIQFGVVFPVRYREGQPFDMSFDDIRVIYPQLNIGNMLSGLAREKKNDIF